MRSEENPPNEPDPSASDDRLKESDSPEQEYPTFPDILPSLSQSGADPKATGSEDLETVEAIVVAEFADAEVSSLDRERVIARDLGMAGAPDPAALRRFHDVVSAPLNRGSLDNLSANGGAVGALVLGIWSIIGVFITNWSIINGVLGLLLGLWGLTSGKRRMAWIGIAFCLVSIFLAMIQVSDLVDAYLKTVDESSM